MGDSFMLDHNEDKTLALLLQENAPTLFAKITTDKGTVNRFVTLYLDKKRIYDLDLIPESTVSRLDVVTALSGG